MKNPWRFSISDNGRIEVDPCGYDDPRDVLEYVSRAVTSADAHRMDDVLMHRIVSTKAADDLAKHLRTYLNLFADGGIALYPLLKALEEYETQRRGPGTYIVTTVTDEQVKAQPSDDAILALCDAEGRIAGLSLQEQLRSRGLLKHPEDEGYRGKFGPKDPADV